MRYDQSSRRRENKTPAAPLPSVPDLGHKITMPRKSNRAAAKLVASGDVFWDKRKVATKARQKALRQQDFTQAHPPTHRLSRNQRKWLLSHLPGWTWSNDANALMAPRGTTEDQLTDFIAATRLPYMQRASLRVQGLSLEQLARVAKQMPSTINLSYLGDTTGAQHRLRNAP